MEPEALAKAGVGLLVTFDVADNVQDEAFSGLRREFGLRASASSEESDLELILERCELFRVIALCQPSQVRDHLS